MKYLAKSVLSNIAKKASIFRKADSMGHGLIIMIPAMPEKYILTIADALASHFILDPNLMLTIKFAQALTERWTAQGKKMAQDHGWLDTHGNLTYYRNMAPGDSKISLVILCGADQGTDTASLSDFFYCDLDMIWQNEMDGSFKDWIITKLDSIGITSLSKDDLRIFDSIIKPIIETGQGDLLQISDWLEEIDVSQQTEVFEIQKMMLHNMGKFGLPSFIGYPLRQKGKTLAPYILKAREFFNYSMFMETREKEKAVKAIECLMKLYSDGESPEFMLEDESIRGPYINGVQLLEGLKKYIETDNKEDRHKLLNCDFVMIIDKILKYREKKLNEPKDSVKKIEGGPVEMLLTAVWFCLRDFYQDKSIPAESQIDSISIQYTLFKHDIEGPEDEDNDSSSNSTVLAREYLFRLIGCLGDVLAKRIEIHRLMGQEINIHFSALDEIACKHSRTAEPQLEFSVKISCLENSEPFRRKYSWRLPEHHSYRLAEALLNRAKFALDVHPGIWKLPVFHLRYYEELLRATSADEIRRVFLYSIRDAHDESDFLTNLLSTDWLEVEDSLLPKLKMLAERYHLFIKEASKQGLLSALFEGTEWTKLRQSFSAAFREATETLEGLHSPTAGMLLRAFLIIQQCDYGKSTAWHSNPFEPSGIVTVLHPALLEMLEAQIIYLITCFNYAVDNEIKSDSRRNSFKQHIWRTYLDLAEIQTPLTGLLHNEDQNLDTNIRGQELIHRIGSMTSANATLSTRLLLNYSDMPDDEEVSDTEMFFETSESKHLLRLMLDYFRLHPHARDSLNLAVFRNDDIQPVIAAIHHYLYKLGNANDPKYFILHAERSQPYSLGVTIFTDSSDDVDVSNWLAQWQERWEAAESDSKFKAYRACKFNVAHRLVERGRLDQFQKLINDNFEADIAVFYDFIGIGTGVNKFENVPEFNLTDRTLKFPILEKACCTIDNPADKFKRSRVISNRQFVLGAQHAKLMHCLKTKSQQMGTVVIGTGDFDPWRSVIDALHTKAEWVICIDPNIDERLLRWNKKFPDKEREIIGFGSGVGTHGEDNYTISTEQFSLNDIHFRLSSRLQSLYAEAEWSLADCQDVAKGVLNVSRELSGLSLVRATGIDDQYIRDFMAFCLSRKMLKAEGSVLCDNLISLDAYRHWFDLAENATRPDLMWLTVKLSNDKRLQLHMSLIECKMAKQAEEFLVRARAQINNGLRVLMPAFAPAPKTDSGTIEDQRPDRRYWWMQLHRLIASKTEIKRAQNLDVLSALENLAEGNFDIEWDAAIFAFWINCNDAFIQNIGQWNTGPDQSISAHIYSMGNAFAKQLAIDPNFKSLNWETFLKTATQAAGNVCDNLNDIELPPGEDEDVDINGVDSDEVSAIDDVSFDVPDIPDQDGPILYVDTPEYNASESKPKEPADTKPSGTTTFVEGASGNVIFSEVSELKVIAQGETKSELKPMRILLGNTIVGQRQVYWEFGHKDLANRHMLIFGMSGMGKTYAIQCLLCELARSNQNCLVIDYTDGFLPSKIENSAKQFIKVEGQEFIQLSPLPINPFKAQVSYEAGLVFQDNPSTIAKRIAAIFKNVYDLGSQQFSLLIDSITEGLEEQGESLNMQSLLEKLHSYLGDGIHSKTVIQSTYTKIKSFISSNPFSTDIQGIGWDEVFSNQQIRNRIFQFHKVDKYSARAMIEFVLWDLYAFVTSHGNKDRPKIIVLDEIQNLDLGQEAPVAKYLTEGRKHGLALVTATQTVKGVGGVNDAKVSRLFQAEMKLFFRPTENEMREHAQLLHNAVSSFTVQEWIQRLAALQKGECWVLGRFLNPENGKLTFQAQRIRISALEERGLHG